MQSLSPRLRHQFRPPTSREGALSNDEVAESLEFMSCEGWRRDSPFAQNVAADGEGFSSVNQNDTEDLLPEMILKVLWGYEP